MAEWRVGRSQLRTIYRDDVLVGLMDSPEIAAEVVAALNGREACPSISSGSLSWGPSGLVYRPDAVRCPTTDRKDAR